MPTVRIQIVKWYDVDVDGDDPVATAYDMGTDRIEAEGRLISVTTEDAELQNPEDDA